MRKRYEIQGSEVDPLEDYKDYEAKKRKDSIHSVSPVVGIVFILILYSLYGTVYLFDGILPTPLLLSDEKSNPDAFIAERARQDLKVLTDIGPRVTGSYENDALAVDFLQREISFIQQQAHPNQKIEIDVQTVSGSYYLDFKPHGGINAYGNVQNVVAKLYSKNESKESLLVNAHFDSVPTSPGGSDDGINCVTMLEVLRKLSRSSEQLQHNVIFLFNGAEETPLQAAHGFITQHKWAKEVRVVINLEAAGAGGKEILFQAGPNLPWLMNYYEKVPRPHGQAAGEEIFQSGLIPSDTDFRIFRDFGNIVGLDFAFSRNGYRYHTKFDDFKNIPFGSYQHVGDNTLSLIRNLANAPELTDPKGQPGGKTIYYDIFGLFMVTYSETTAIVINVLVSLLSLVVAIRSFHNFGLGLSCQSVLYLGLTVGLILLGWVVSGIFVIAIAVIVDGLKFSMSWYNNPWIVLGLYVLPVALSSCGIIVALNRYYDKNNLSIGAQTQIQIHLLRLIWTVPLLVATFFGLRFVYVILLPVLFHSLTFAVIQMSSIQHSIRKWQVVYIVGTLIPTMFIMQQAIQVVGVLIPICGRMGPDRNPEMYIGILVFLITILTISFYVPLITLVRKPSVILATLSVMFLAVFIVVFTPLGFPYSGNPESPAPQRFWIYHTSRKFHNETNDIYKKDAGFFLLNLDRNSPNSVKKYVRDLNRVKSVAEDCDRSIFCGLPVAHSRMIPIINCLITDVKGTWIPAEQPIIHEPITLKLNSKTGVKDSITRYNFTASGPSSQAIYISTREGATLINTNLLPELPKAIDWNGRPTYIIMYTWGKENTPLTFTLDFKTPANWNRPTFDIALVGKYMHDRLNVKTPHYIQFLSEFPNWADVVAWLATFESWVY